MRSQVKILGVLFCTGALGLGGVVFAQTKDDKKPADAKGGAQPGGDEMAKMMELMKKAATPGEFHNHLKPLVGKWTFTTKYRMSPDGPWEQSTGNAVYKWILGGRILVHEVKANPSPDDAMMGGPFEGFGLTGYDNVSKKYFNVWLDNMGTGMMSSTGSCDSSGKTITYMGDYNDPMTGKVKTVKSILKIAGDDKVVFEMYDKGPDGKEYASLEVSYVRAK